MYSVQILDNFRIVISVGLRLFHSFVLRGQVSTSPVTHPFRLPWTIVGSGYYQHGIRAAQSIRLGIRSFNL